MNTVNKGIRIINFALDLLVIIIISLILRAILGSQPDIRIVAFFVFLLYYISMENIWGQTVGKMVTRTMVINSENGKPGFLMIIFRTILRLNPFDYLSYLFGSDLGSHDTLSKTRVVNKPARHKEEQTSPVSI